MPSAPFSTFNDIGSEVGIDIVANVSVNNSLKAAVGVDNVRVQHLQAAIDIPPSVAAKFATNNAVEAESDVAAIVAADDNAEDHYPISHVGPVHVQMLGNADEDLLEEEERPYTLQHLLQIFYANEIDIEEAVLDQLLHLFLLLKPTMPTDWEAEISKDSRSLMDKFNKIHASPVQAGEDSVWAIDKRRHPWA